MECVCIPAMSLPSLDRQDNNVQCQDVCAIKPQNMTKYKRTGQENCDNEQLVDSSIPYPKPPASVELRSGVLISGCQCVKRDGLQHDCPRTGCQGRGACMAYPAPMCGPSGNAPPEYLEPSTEYSAEYGDRRLRPRVNREHSPRPGYYPGGADDRYIRLGRRGYRENPPVKHKERVPCREHRKIRG